jgi:death on curing protein
MRYLTLAEVVELHRRLLRATGGAPGIRDPGALESAIAQPKANLLRRRFASLAGREGGGTLLFAGPGPSLRRRNKRVGHAAMETFLVLNGTEVEVEVGDQERVMLDLAAGRIDRSQLTAWLRQHLKPLA